MYSYISGQLVEVNEETIVWIIMGLAMNFLYQNLWSTSCQMWAAMSRSIPICM